MDISTSSFSLFITGTEPSSRSLSFASKCHLVTCQVVNRVYFNLTWNLEGKYVKGTKIAKSILTSFDRLASERVKHAG